MYTASVVYGATASNVDRIKAMVGVDLGFRATPGDNEVGAGLAMGVSSRRRAIRVTAP